MTPEELQRAVKDARAIVRYGFPWWLRLVMMRGVAGITLGRHVYLHAECEVAAALRHELVHVRQIARYGVLRFYWRWLCEYALNRWRGMSSHEAYRRISFEREAFGEENV